jgi:uncharacterized OB-fold protein
MTCNRPETGPAAPRSSFSPTPFPRRSLLPESATTTEPQVRPLVPHLTLGETRDKDYLNGSRCKNCNTLYVGPRLFCGKCSTDGPFESVRLSDNGEVHVWTIIHQATPYVQAPYIAAVVDLPEGVSVNTNIVGIDPQPENVKFGMKVKMFTEKVSEDREGNSYVAYRFKPA